MILSVLIFIGKIVIGFLAYVVLYFSMAFLLSWLPKHRHYTNSEEGYEVYVISNGVHTDFVLPTEHLPVEWKRNINFDDFEYSKEELKYMGFGWGDRGFYLDTPSWAELKLSTAVNALFIPSPTLMHIKAFDKIPEENKNFEKLTLTSIQFSNLCDHIWGSFSKNHIAGPNIITLLPNKGYTPNDNFYHARGSYHMFNTCNFWVNNGLRKAGVRTSIWTPVDRGVFYQLKKIPVWNQNQIFDNNQNDDYK